MRGGGYVGFVDSDDHIAPDMYEKMVNKLLSENADICACNYYFVDEAGRKDAPAKIIDGVYTSKCVLKMLAKKVWTEGVGSVFWNKLFRSSNLQTIRFPKYNISEDEAVLASVVDTAKKVVCTNEPLYYYTVRNESLIHSADLKTELCRINALISKNAVLIKNSLYDAVLFTVLKAVKEILRIHKIGKGNIDTEICAAREKLYSHVCGIIKTIPNDCATVLYKPIFAMVKIMIRLY